MVLADIERLAGKSFPPTATLPSISAFASTPTLITFLSCSGTSIFISRVRRMSLVCLDDHLDQFVADDVFVGEINKLYPFEIF